MPLISVIVPCYNQAQYLDECLQSVLDQTFHDWECIIVNDGSPDNTEEVAKRWVEKDTRFRYLFQENKGVSAARNFGIGYAEGEWILPLDGDDKISENYLDLAKNEFHKGYSVIYCEAQFFGRINAKWSLPPYSYKTLLLGNIIFCCAFYKKNKWLTINGYDTQLIHGKEDWEFWISVLDKESTLLQLEHIGFYYRQRDNSRDAQVNEDRKKLENIREYVFRKHKSKYIDTYPYTLEAITRARADSEAIFYYKNLFSKNIITKGLFQIATRISLFFNK